MLLIRYACNCLKSEIQVHVFPLRQEKAEKPELFVCLKYSDSSGGAVTITD